VNIVIDYLGLVDIDQQVFTMTVDRCTISKKNKFMLCEVWVKCKVVIMLGVERGF